MQPNGRDGADRKPIAIVEQTIELRSVTLELRTLVENLAEYRLDCGDSATDRKLAAELFLKERRSGQVIGTEDDGTSWADYRLPQGVQDVYAVACI